MQTKVCTRCGEQKELSLFHRHSRHRDGRQHACKVCRNEANRTYRLKNIEHINEYHRSYRQTPSAKTAHDIHVNTYRALNPLKKQAWSSVLTAIRNGKLKRQPCEVCRDTKVHAHHDDYSKPLEVRWLCSLHHREHHRKLAS